MDVAAGGYQRLSKRAAQVSGCAADEYLGHLLFTKVSKRKRI